MAGDFTDEEIAQCQAQLDAVIDGGVNGGGIGEGMFLGAFQEAAGTKDPTGGLVIAFLPMGDGPIKGQMVNTYLDCLGQMGTGGTYRGERVGEQLSGQ